MATRPKVEELKDKHWQALELIEAGSTNMAEVARAVNISTPDFNHLIHGNVEKMGNIAQVFNLEYSKIIQKKISRSEKNITRLLNECQETALIVISREIALYEKKKTLNGEQQKMLTYLTKAVATLKPTSPTNLKISQSWNYTKGLSTQELEHEYSRLKGISEGPPDTKRVQEAK